MNDKILKTSDLENNEIVFYFNMFCKTQNDYQIVGTKLEQIILKNYLLLSEMKKRAVKDMVMNYRYNHTLRLVKSLIAIIRQDYYNFLTIDQRAIERGQTKLTLEQFLNICEKFQVIINNELDFLLGLIITHDYGTLEDLVSHPDISERLCETDLLNQGFSSRIELAQLILRNHTYFGEFLLGESSLDFGFQMFENCIEAKLDSKKFFQLLWAVTVLDINSCGSGFLTYEKYLELNKLDRFEGLEQYKNNYFENRVKQLNDSFENDKTNRALLEADRLDKRVVNLNIPYFNRLLNRGAFTYDLKHEFVNILVEFWNECRKDNKFTYIVFEHSNNEFADIICLNIKKYLKGIIPKYKLCVNNGEFLNIPYRIVGKYLRIGE